MHLRAPIIRDQAGALARTSTRREATQIGRAMCHAVLSSVIERAVIPELVSGFSRRDWSTGPERETAELTALALGSCATAVTDYVAGLHLRGRSAESLCLQLLTPVARRLGEGWINDTCDFTEVTIGVWRLHDAMRMLWEGAPDRPGCRSALLTALPGEQHTFGIAMVSAFFRRAGWDAWGAEAGTTAELLALVRGRRLDMVGLSISGHEFLDAARLLIVQLRAQSTNPGLVVMVGGQPFLGSPELAAAIGADATAADAPASELRASELVAARRGASAAIAG